MRPMIITTDHVVAENTLRLNLRDDFGEWAGAALPPEHKPAAHHRLLMSRLADLCAGEIDRLMVLMPPGSAKSTYGSVLFVPWWLSRHPASSVIACAHTDSLAEEFGGRVRGLIGEHSLKLGYGLGGRRARHDFRTTCGGSYYAAGVHGAITGRRADLILIDDPVRSHADVESPQQRENLWNWYRSDLLTRLKPGGRVVLIMTRWHPDDIGGRLLQHERHWHCLRLPALAEADDPLGRAVDAPLWPEWEGAEDLARKRAIVGEHAWAALFQQSPRPKGDLLFKAGRLAVIDTAAPTQTVRGWDLAATGADRGGDPDWTVGVKLGREASGRFVVLDVIRLRGEPLAVEQAILRAAQVDGAETVISLPQDPGQAGKTQIRYLASQLAGFRVQCSAESGSKSTRAMPVASQIEAGNVALMRGQWNYAFLEEMGEFPVGRKDDQVDALSRAFAGLVEAGAPARMLDTAFMRR
jgi:predicted phage terminase large subunit-like protein